MKEIMDAMRMVRRDLEWHAYKKYAQSQHDLCGYCAIASIKLFQSLRKIVPICIVGNEEHWFNIVQIKNEYYLIDITATQFNDCVKYEFRKYPQSVYEEHWDYWHVFSDVRKFKKYLREQYWGEEEINNIKNFKISKCQQKKKDIVYSRLKKITTVVSEF